MYIGVVWHFVKIDGERTVKKLLEGKTGKGRKKRKAQIKVGG
jgi:hypothetical protein